MTFPAYPEYKDSGVEWLGYVPMHWKVRRLKDVGNFISGSGFPHDAQGDTSESLPYYKVSDLADASDGRHMVDAPNTVSEEKAYQLGARIIPSGAVLWAKIGAALLLNRRRISTRPCCIDNNMTAYCPNHQRLNPEWAYYWSSQLDFAQFANPGAVPSLGEGYQATLPALLPPLSEQARITAFLDHETARIDALIEEQQRLIELLKEKRQAVISHAVTKGLDPDVPMKDSGVEWLGEVPGHWDVLKFKYVITDFEQGWSPQCDGEPVESTNEWGVLKVGCVNHGKFDPTENKRLPHDLEARPELAVREGDLLISRANTRELVGSAAQAPMDYPNLMASDKLFVVRLHRENCIARFAAAYLSDHRVRHQIELQATGASSSMLNIGQGAIRELWIPLPPKAEQDRIVNEIEKREAGFAALERETAWHIQLLNERRAALVSAAVTGRIDVRGWEPPQSHAEGRQRDGREVLA